MKAKFFATPMAFRAWLEENHDCQAELIVGFHKKGSGKASITWPESVDQALCFGWIDGVRRSLSDDDYCIRFTPRKTSSIWSAINVDKVQKLTALGLMTPAGLRAFAARKAHKTAIYSFERKQPATLLAEEDERLRANRKAAAFFDKQAPWYQRTVLHWIVSAKRDDTRKRRLSTLIETSAAGQTINQFTRRKITK